MDWDKIFNASLYPIIAMLLLQLVSFWSIAVDIPYLLLLAGLILTILPTLIYAYAGYSAVKDRKFTIQEAAATGVLISIINTVASTILMLQIATLRTGGSGAYENTIFSAVALVSLVIGLVFNSFWGGLFAAIGGAIARKPIEDAQQKAKKIETKTNWVLLAALPVIIILGFLFLLFLYLPPVDHPVSYQCTFPAGLTCTTSKLQTGSSKLTLQIGQGTGKTIRVTGIACTQNSSGDYATNAYINYAPATNITMESGTTAFLAKIDGSGAAASIICTDESGNLPPNTAIGNPYNGRIYINYTEVETGITRITVGTLSTKYEA